MDMLPQLAVGIAPATRALNLPFAELPKEQQIDLLIQQMLQQQQLIGMQQMRIDSLNTIQDSVAVQGAQLQALTLETNRLAEEEIAATKEILAASKQENVAKEAEIAMLKALLNSQKETYTESQEAARQALAKQSRAIEELKRKNDILMQVFETSELAMEEAALHPTYGCAGLLARRQGLLNHYVLLPQQIAEARAQLQQNIQNQAAEAQAIRDQ